MSTLGGNVKIRLQNQGQTKIRVQDRGGLLVQPATGSVTIKNEGSAVAPLISLETLTDVNLTIDPPVDGSTLIYNANTAQYDVDVMDLDGGLF